jgi:pimeloyl-ACP methyl ester carboxylesterase
MSEAVTAVRDRSVRVWDDELDIHVRTAGSGPPLVHLHGAGGPRWDPLLDRLAETRTVYAVEHPGTSAGDPDAIHRVDSLWDLLLIYDEVLTALELNEPAVVVGESYGGMLACELAASFPGLFRKLVLLAPIGLWRDDAPIANWVATPAAQLPALLFHDPSGPAAQAMLTPPADPDAAVTAISSLVWSIGCTAKFVWPVPDKGLSKRLHRVRTPALVVWGRQDRLAPVAYAEEFGRRLSGSRVEVVEECGHLLAVEQQDATLALITDFLSS